ncbi:MAG: carbonic anhydrase [Campylobacter sp.]|nr:carbonic anhydrase [Campylobacter sp.]
MNDRIISGAVKFMEENFLEHRELFENLANHQTPHTLFVGCADSRVVPNLITSTLPGELFVVRNIANIVPPYRVSNDFVATTAAIEYALYALEIKNIIICGHSNCGGCAALYYESEKLEKIPNVKKWLNLLDPVKKEISEIKNLEISKRDWITERLNIINSIKNLLTFPNLANLHEKGEIKIYGWHYIIETGELFDYDHASGHFKILTKEKDYEKVYNQLFSDY